MMTMRMFDERSATSAMYMATCPLCNQRILRGDSICPEVGGGTWAHYSCVFQVNRGRPPQPPRREEDDSS